MSATRRALLEQAEQGARKREFDKRNMQKMVSRGNALANNIASDARVENLRRIRAEQLGVQLAREKEMKVEEERKRQEHSQHLRETEERLKQEEDRRSAQERGVKVRQSICNNSQELRDLEQKLNSAYTSKERAMQIQEKILDDQRNRIQELGVTEKLNQQLEHARQLELEQSKIRHDHQIEYKAALNKQLEDRDRRKQAEYEQFLREKAMVDEIVRQINQEDLMEAMRHLEKQRETKQYIEDFMKERELWSQLEREKTESENLKIEEYARLQLEREQEVKEKRKTLDTARSAIYDKLAAEMEEQERSKTELEDLRIELYREEQEESDRQKDLQMMQNRIRKRLELIDAYQQQMLFKRIRLQKELEEEDAFREKMMLKFAQEEKIEQLNDQRRRMKQLEHKRAVDVIIKERRRLEEEERLEEVEMENRQKEMEDYKKAVVEQERQRLLSEHAAKLIGFLPKGVFRDQKDLGLFDEEFQKKFQPRALPYELV